MNFSCRRLPGLPATGPPPYQFKSEHQRPHSEGIVVQVTVPGGPSWVGNFQPGEGGLSDVFGCPGHDRLCVVAGGQGYLLTVQRPWEYQIVAAHPITQVYPMPEKGLIVFADYTRLVAYAAAGVAWRSERLSWDGLEIIGVSGGRIIATAWDSPSQKEVRLAIDIDSGKPHVVSGA